MAKYVAEHFHRTMRYFYRLNPQIAYRGAPGHFNKVYLGNTFFPNGVGENIRKLIPHGFQGNRGAINGNALILHETKTTQIIESENVVGMRVREQYGIHALNPEGQDLISKVRRSVDDYVEAGCLHIDAATSPLVPRIARSAHRTRAPDSGNAMRSARA